MRAAPLLLLLALPALRASTPAPQAPHPVPQGQAAAAVPGAAQGDALAGRVVECIQASPYSYLRLQTAKGEVWAAIPAAVLDPGTEVTVANPMLMANFESKTLKRTFPEIYFGTAATPAGTVARPGHPAAPSPAGEPVKIGKIQKAAGANALQVGEIWRKKATLKEKPVTVRGKVTQYAQGIMGKNWVHLQDGSGDPKKGTHDITLTTQDRVAKGDVVTFQGIVRLKKDFGSGYAYEVLIEDASIVKTWRSAPAK